MVGLGPLLDILRMGEGLMVEALPLPGDSIVQLVQNTHLEASYSHKKWRSSPQKNWAPGLLTSTTTIAQKLKSAVIFALLDSLSLSLCQARRAVCLFDFTSLKRITQDYQVKGMTNMVARP